jgi:hypothetical protein
LSDVDEVLHDTKLCPQMSFLLVEQQLMMMELMALVQ